MHNAASTAKQIHQNDGVNKLMAHVSDLRRQHLRTHNLLYDIQQREAALQDVVGRLLSIKGHSDFDDDKRGAAYRAKQLTQPTARDHGDQQLFRILEEALGGFGPHQTGVDVIGGNGTTARSAARLIPAARRPYVISADPCYDMVADTLAQGLPAVWQSAQETLFCDDSLDFVVGSRGFHHIDTAARPSAFAEAFRVLRPKGVAMIIDFEEGTPTARWYSEGLHQYTHTGHDFRHFQIDEMQSLLKGAGFINSRVCSIYDPFIFHADSAELARNRLLEHVIGLFGMFKLSRNANESDGAFWQRVDRTIAPWCTFTSSDVAIDPEAVRRLSVFQTADGQWRAEMPRIALCAIGFKP